MTRIIFFSYLNFERQWLLILYTMNNAVWKNILIIQNFITVELLFKILLELSMTNGLY